MAKVRLFEYAVVLQPKTDKDGEITEDGLLVVPPECVLASDESQASLKAARAIPERVHGSPRSTGRSGAPFLIDLFLDGQHHMAGAIQAAWPMDVATTHATASTSHTASSLIGRLNA